MASKYELCVARHYTVLLKEMDATTVAYYLWKMKILSLQELEALFIFDNEVDKSKVILYFVSLRSGRLTFLKFCAALY